MLPPGCCNQPLVVPDEMAVKYVRVWQHPSPLPPPPPPAATTTAASGVVEGQATLNGEVNGNGVDAEYRFEYGETSAYELSTPWVASGSGDSKESVTVTGLRPGTTYHYRLVAKDSAGKAEGSDQTFTTLEQPDVFFADANSSAEMGTWTWSEPTGWQLRSFLGDQVAAKSSPSGLIWNGTPNVFFVDKSDSNELSDWAWSVSEGWQLQSLSQHEVEPGTSPAALMINGTPNVFFADKSDNGELSDWTYSATEGWHITQLYRDAVAAGTSPSAMMWNGKPYVFFSDKSGVSRTDPPIRRVLLGFFGQLRDLLRVMLTGRQFD